MKGTASVVLFAGMLAVHVPAAGAETPGTLSPSVVLEEAQRHFYSGRYEAAASLALSVRTADAVNLAASELRSSALLFQIKRLLGKPEDKKKAWNACAECQDLRAAFLEEIAIGQSTARERLAADPTDEAALYFLGKIDLNYIWLHLGPLGQRTGWSEYREARRSLEAVLERNPEHVRARISLAWIEYIVDTRAPWGTKWLLGGGDKDRGLRMVEDAARSQADPFALAEARFALWDMQVREENLPGAIETARSLSQEFPDNPELVKFLETHATTASAR